ncbi:MAG: medium chain dehydrogenase/reductase family protein [Chloroflexota bacterium]
MNNASQTNERVLITRHGGPPMLELVEAATPLPRKREVLVRVEAAGVAFADVLMRRGLYPGTPDVPFVPGYDVVGIVEAVGEGVSDLQVGRRIAALIQTGGYSRYIRVEAWRCVPVPDGIEPAQAVAVVLNYVTAHQMLHRVAGVRAGESMLVHGAAGGVGTALVELGRLAFLQVYGTASRGKHDVVRHYGAIPVDYRREDFVERVLTLTGNGVDFVFDAIGGNHWIRSYRTLKPGGTLVMFGASAALQNGERNPASLLPGVLKLGLLLFVPDGRRTVGYFVPTAIAQNRKHYREDLAFLLNMLAEGKIEPLVSTRLPLTEVVKAHELLENSAVPGKIVLMCDR